LPKVDEERSRFLVLKNLDELTDGERIQGVLGFDGVYSDQILLKGILESLLNAGGYHLGEEDVIQAVVAIEERVLEASKSPESLRYEDQKAVEILSVILEVALDNNELSNEEIRLIRRLREKLGLKDQSKNFILAQLGHYPGPGNLVHSGLAIRKGLVDLQKKGVLFYCNKLDGGRYLIPEEMVPAVRTALGIELSEVAWRQLLDSLRGTHLTQILDSSGLPKSGTKDDKAERIIAAGILPSKALDSLSNQDLYEVCSSLPGARVSGSKQEKMNRVIDYFSTLTRKEVSSEAPVAEVYFNYFAELASRDRETLLVNKVIKKDLDMEHAFEEATRYIFKEKMGLTLEEFKGSEHPDGAFRFKRSGDLLMWDNKSKESNYDFPPSHLRQFKRYIRDSETRVSCFLVIVPKADVEKCEDSALRLKVESLQDTDVAVINAEDLSWMADNWKSFEKKEGFNPEVLNYTGVLTRRVLTQRMRLLL
jgi:hypothetical protein